MRAYELFESTTAFFLGSDVKLEGIVSRADLQLVPDPRFIRVERILEDARPDDCLSRASCLIMAERLEDLPRLGMPTDHIYRVKPVGAVQRSDHGWWTMIYQGLQTPLQERPPLDEWARSYWSNIECINSPHQLWEFRCESAKILD